MENPFNSADTRVGFLRLGYEEPDMRNLYLLFEKIRKEERRNMANHITSFTKERTIDGNMSI